MTDARVFAEIRQSDEASGKWLVEDPSLVVMQRCLGTRE